MLRFVFFTLLTLFLVLKAEGKGRITVVADSTTHSCLSGATIFDRKGNAIGVSDKRGRVPALSADRYPIVVRYLGFKEKSIPSIDIDTVFLQESFADLPELVIETRRHKVIHVLAYMREYSNLTSYTDTVFLFREKMIDYILVPDQKIKFKGWSNPRVLSSKSYYRFTDNKGLDSVSDVSNHNFSWSDWIGIPGPIPFPKSLRKIENGTDTLKGKYSPTETWTKKKDRVSVDINVLADAASRKWVPKFYGFYKKEIDYDKFNVRYNYDNVLTDTLSPLDISGYSFNIESGGRGHNMFRFNKYDEPYYVSTYAEVYIMDKEYITLKEAKKWDNRNFKNKDIDIYEAAEAPPLQPDIRNLVARVDGIDHEKIRLDQAPDRRLISHNLGKQNFSLGNRVLTLIKDLTGITLYKSRKNMKKRWSDFKKSRSGNVKPIERLDTVKNPDKIQEKNR